MKLAKKIAVLFAALTMVMAMSAVSFADAGTTLNIPKKLVVSNPTLTSVDGPGLTYNYTIEGVTPTTANGGTAIDDGQGHSAVVKAGVAGGASLTTSSVSWPVGTAVTASSSGAENEKNITMSVDLTAFNGVAGIYRYQITESATPTAPSTIGVEDTDAAEVRYVDVYLSNGDNGLQVDGYKVHKGDTEPAGGGTRPVAAAFDNSTFETVNVTLSKEVTGNMGDKQNQFPFAATISDNSRFYRVNKGSVPADATATSTSGSESTTLAHGETYYIAGLSKAATVAYTETNNTNDKYQVTPGGGSPTAVNAGGTISMEAKKVTEASTVTFTNKLDSVSPTGVILRYGAPLLILAAAIALFVMNRKAKAGSEK